MIIGTAGHIDHGKSALVEALTGRRMDPLEEERRRGITIDLHFAELSLPDGRSAGVVDVPGHEALIRTMVAGAGGMDLVLLVIAADDGIMPQTREHLAVVEQLRVPLGIPVITKADLVEPEWLDLVLTEAAAWLAGSAVRFGPPVATSVRSGTGIEELRSMIAALPATPRPRGAAGDLFRLPIDRAFSLPGTGTVVTGTAWSGALYRDASIRLLPGGQRGRVRTLERHGRPVQVVGAGDRAAVAVAGLDRQAIRRGEVLVGAEDPWECTTALDIRAELLPTAPRPLSAHSRIRVHLGTAEVLARVKCREPLVPGHQGLLRLALEQPVLARGQDRLVLRSYSPPVTIGGGEVLDPLPPQGRPAWSAELDSDHAATRLVGLLLRRSAGIRTAQLAQLLGLPPDEAAAVPGAPEFTSAGEWVFLAREVGSLADTLLEVIRAHHRRQPSEAGMSVETVRAGRGALAEVALERLAAAGRVVIEHGMVRDTGHRAEVAGGGAELERIVSAVEAAGLTPPSAAELAVTLGAPDLASALRLAVREGRLVAVERDRFYGPRALAGFRAALAKLSAEGPFTPAAVREATGLSRKFLIPLLEWADRGGLTVRQGDARVAGPALKAPQTTG